MSILNGRYSGRKRLESKEVDALFGITYHSWKTICTMYFNLGHGKQKAYLQFFPFSKLNKQDKAWIASEDFFLEYVQSGYFVMSYISMYCTENYIQKSDVSFRDSTLVSPILFLVLQSLGKEISDNYIPNRSPAVSVYYAGNYEHNRGTYKLDYDNFFKEINENIENYQYFIKTDISNFYSNINLNKLVYRIDQGCTNITQTQLLLLKKLLECIGNTNFPLVENSIISSYLSTIIYLDPIDNELYNYISTYIKDFTNFKMIRYVDDLYILISSEDSVEHLHKIYNEIRNEYSSILKKYDLSLNTKKCAFKPCIEVNNELKKSLYDEYINSEKCNIETLFTGTLLGFLTDLATQLSYDYVSIEQYNQSIQKHFYKEDIEFTPNDVLNYFIYEDITELQSPEIVAAITSLVNQDISFISLDPKRLTIMIMKTKSSSAIKAFLNQLFQHHRNNKWNSYDTTIAIAYLIQSKFNHIDLLSALNTHVPKLYYYYECYCKNSFVHSLKLENEKIFSEIIKDDSRTYFLFFMYYCENQNNDYLAAFAYYKNFFDRISALIAFYTNKEINLKKPNYKRYYKEKELINLYQNIPNSDYIIKKAHTLRNDNPLSHASARLIDNNNTSAELRNCINSLHKLLIDCINQL